MTPREVYKEYSAVDPFEHAPLDLLFETYSVLGDPRVHNIFKSVSRQLLSQASVAAEISLHREASIKAKRFYGERAHSLLTFQTVNGHYMVGDILSEPLRAHLPLYSAIPHEDKLPENLARSLFRILDNTDEDGAAKGFACEVATSLIANGMQEHGIKAYPALMRQDTGNRAGLDNHHFDLMVESDGTAIEAGRYPVQVKAAAASSNSAYHYHPKITKIYFETLTKSNLSDLSRAMGKVMLNCISMMHSGLKVTLHTPDDISERFLNKLDETGPLDQEMLLTQLNANEAVS